MAKIFIIQTYLPKLCRLYLDLMLDLALKVKKGRERHIKETHHILDTIRLLLLHCKYVYTAKALKYSRSAVKLLYSNTKNSGALPSC